MKKQRESDAARLCRKQFLLNNKKNFFLTILTVFVMAGSRLLLAFMTRGITEAMELKDLGRLRDALIFAGFAAAGGLFTGLMSKTYRNRYMKEGLSQFKKYVFDKLFQKSIGQFGDTSSGKFISAFSNDINSIEINYLAGNIHLISQVISFVGGFFAMLYVDWRLMLCVMVTALGPMFVSMKYGRRIKTRERQTSEINEGFVDQIKDLLNGFIIIKSFKAEKEVLQIFDKQNAELEETKRARREANDMVGIISEASFTIVLIVLVAVGTFFVFGGTMTIGSVLAFVQLSSEVLNPISKIVTLWSNHKAAVGLVSRISDVIEAKDDSCDKIEITDIEQSIMLQNVSFSYDDGKMAISDVSIEFEKGKSYAVVGSSGGGKSTLLRLLLGHLSHYQGEITIDGKELRSINLDSLYDVISVIQQNVFLFDSSIKDNITMFKSFPQEKYREAISMAGLSALIDEKGDDYDCGEAGGNLSGGEKQRVSIARCLIRETPVLLMDEATAALDNATAAAVSNAILDIDGLTRIIVTHKFEESIMRRYDRIIVIQKGGVAESGTFDELMGMKKYFYSLFNVAQEEDELQPINL
ncbi:MAG: ABC transporter ATP-binding protein/permease [Oscillospiraceae bacterium]|nr:ABC transporter ATP-binding protein/permease [Oscillospiraceae bacterium]